MVHRVMELDPWFLSSLQAGFNQYACNFQMILVYCHGPNWKGPLFLGKRPSASHIEFGATVRIKKQVERIALVK